MAKTVSDIAQMYQHMEPRQISDLLRSSRVRNELGTDKVSEMTVAAAVRYWPPEVRDLHSIRQEHAGEKDFTINKLYGEAWSKLGLTPDEVDAALDYTEKVSFSEHGTVQWSEE